MIESKSFVATTTDIQDLVRASMEATETVGAVRQTYLRALIGTTQAELKGTKDVTEGMQLKSLAIVHKRFYQAVLEVVTTSDLADNARLRPEEKTRRSLERNRRSNFARSAHSTLRSWLKSGARDLLSLNPAKVVKSQLIAETPRHGPARVMKPDKIRTKVDKLVETLLLSTRQLANSDPSEARTVLDGAMQRIAKELFMGAVTPTNDPVIAIKDHRPLKAANALFWPTDTQVIRRQRMKAAA